MIITTHWSVMPPWGATEPKEKVHMETLDEFVARHRRENNGLRLGQRFVNEYTRAVPGTDANEMYNVSDEVALEMIRQYLSAWHYHPHMPPRIK